MSDTEKNLDIQELVERIRQEDQEVNERNADTVQRLRELLKPPPSVDPVDLVQALMASATISITDFHHSEAANAAAFAEVAARLPDRLGRPKTMPDLLLALDQWRAQEAKMKWQEAEMRAERSARFNAGAQHAFSKVRNLCRIPIETSPADVLARVTVLEDIAEAVAQTIGTNTNDPAWIRDRLVMLLDHERWILDFAEILDCMPEREKISAAIARVVDRSRRYVTITERLGAQDTLDVVERVTKLITELEDARIKMHVAFEMLGATRSLLADDDHPEPDSSGDAVCAIDRSRILSKVCESAEPGETVFEAACRLDRELRGIRETCLNLGPEDDLVKYVEGLEQAWLVLNERVIELRSKYPWVETTLTALRAASENK